MCNGFLRPFLLLEMALRAELGKLVAVFVESVVDLAGVGACGSSALSTEN